MIKFLKQEKFDFEKTKFPKGIYAIAVIIAITLNPLRNKLSGLVATEIFSKETIYEPSEYLSLYGTTTAVLGTCSWIALIVLSIYFYRYYKNSERSNE